MTTDQGSFNVTVGCFQVTNIRNYFNRCKFKGFNIEFYEEKESCWILPKTTFYVKGDSTHVKQVFDYLNAWICEQWLKENTKTVVTK